MLDYFQYLFCWEGSELMKPMKLYTFVFAEDRNGFESTTFYLAENDIDFLEQLRANGACDIEDPPTPDRDATELEWVNYHDNKIHFHTFMAHALGNNEFKPELTDARGRWSCQDIDAAELDTLRRLGIGQNSVDD